MTFTYPFEHYILTNPFSDSLYAEMLGNLPRDNEYSVCSTAYRNRLCYDMSSPFWTSVKSKMVKDYGPNCVIRLFRDKPGYEIGPHTDGKGDLHSMLFYLPTEELPCGTVLYKPKKKGFSSDGTEHLLEKDFDVAKTIPHKPNTALGFSRSDTSFHGVRKCEFERNLIILLVK